MRYYFRNHTGAFPMVGEKAAPDTKEAEEALIDSLQDHKTELYKELIAEKAVSRPGVIELRDEALADPRIAVGVCSASTKALGDPPARSRPTRCSRLRPHRPTCRWSPR